MPDKAVPQATVEARRGTASTFAMSWYAITRDQLIELGAATSSVQENELHDQPVLDYGVSAAGAYLVTAYLSRLPVRHHAEAGNHAHRAAVDLRLGPIPGTRVDPRPRHRAMRCEAGEPVGTRR